MNTVERLVGPYKVLERLGEGGMGEVFRAVDTMLEREVALKTLRPEMGARAELVERFRVEAIALARLHHRHIAAVYAFFRDGERHHIAMQYIRGRTLEAVLRERGRLPWREAAAVAADVLLALEHAHVLGVVHRDLKPANLMIDGEGRTVVMDFGIARVLAKGRQTRAGTLVGTLEYIAPEIVRGEAADARSDLYALGCVLYEMVSGELPFDASSDYALMRAHAEQAPPRPGAHVAELPGALEAIILRALAKQPADRFADAQAFRAALLAAVGGGATLPEPSHPRPRPFARLARALPALRPALHSVLSWLELPRGGGWQAWGPWLRGNPGLAGVAAVTVGGLCAAFTLSVYAWCCSAPAAWRAATLPATETPTVAVPVATDRSGTAPVSIATTPVVAVPVLVPAPTPAEAKPAPTAFVTPPTPKPRVSVERSPVGPKVEAAPVTPSRVATPSDSKPDPKPTQSNGWYVKH